MAAGPVRCRAGLRRRGLDPRPRRRGTGCSGSSRRATACRSRRTTTRGRACRSTGRWRGGSPMRRCSWTRRSTTTACRRAASSAPRRASRGGCGSRSAPRPRRARCRGWAREERRAVEDTAALLRGLGHDVVERDPDYPGVAVAGRDSCGSCAASATTSAASMPHPERLEPRTRHVAALGGRAPARPRALGARGRGGADRAAGAAVGGRRRPADPGGRRRALPRRRRRALGRPGLPRARRRAADLDAGLEHHRPAGGRGARGARRRRAAGRRAAGRAPRRGCGAAVAGGADRGARGRGSTAGRGRSRERRDGALLDIAVEAARTAGALLLERFGSERVLATKSTSTDLVSAADLAAEAAIREILGRRAPDDAIMGEEGDDTPGRPGGAGSSTRSTGP